MEESLKFKILARVIQRYHVQRCKTDDTGGRCISYFHCRLSVTVCNSKLLQMNRLNTSVKRVAQTDAYLCMDV